MPKEFLKRWMPDHNKIRNSRFLNKVFGTLLHDPNLLHLNRRSVSGAFFVGFFMAFVPLPTQMLFAAAAAIYFRVNLPISIGLVWLTNPFTITPMFYFAYKVGAWSLGTEVMDMPGWDWDTLKTQLALIWQPFLLGCLICGLVSGIIGYISLRLMWRLHVVRRWRARRELKAKN